MNGPHFEEWFEKKLLPNFDANSVIVMDNAPYHSILKTFVKEPLSKYKKATEELKYHESTQYHQFSVEKALNFKDTFNSAPGSSKQHISYMLDKKKAAVVEHNRKRLKPIVKTILFCARNNLPLRGHRDDGKMNNEDCLDHALKGKQGVFRSLLAFRIDAGDNDLKSHLSTCNDNASYISKSIQNDIIECIGVNLRSQIVENVKESKFFSIICDETTDVSRKEQLTFCVRYIDRRNCVTKEEFLGFVELKSTTSCSIKAAIDAEMDELGLSYKYLCGQGYDGASNMAGHLRGVQALITQEQPMAIYTHCFSHSLNLCITKSCEVPVVRNAVGTVEAASVFLSASAHRTNALIKVPEEQQYTD
ncbi:hypothetical protein JTE90_022423 [Oedothorax gibbosus]|uniref:DUF4371 domain-containing protein n=1 Tax=Oedothorax gibbosus TaxID=931172 RepID=A0AAV6TJ17_9ARAC|nr:hypothetical protein JTE90_022423 [Oedothorax gibbosus]